MEKLFAKFANATARVTGSPAAFLVCVLLVLVWAVTGPAFNFSETWQLVINTGTTIVTFLMVFLIQNTQNRDGAALQAKLDELIRSSSAGNKYIGIERLTDHELEQLHSECELTAKKANQALARMHSEREARAGRKAPAAKAHSKPTRKRRA